MTVSYVPYRSRWARWATAAALVALVLGVLCGPAAARAATATGTPPGTPSPSPTPTASVTLGASGTARAAASAVDRPSFAPDLPAPGCRPRVPADGAGQPGTPARHGTPYELLPVLFESGGPGDSWGLDQFAAAPRTGRGPPPAGPPTPVDLSVLLRV